MNEYKMRAECLHDINEFLRIQAYYSRKFVEGDAVVKSFNIIDKDTRYPDCEMSFKSDYPMGLIKDILGYVNDSHVMIETLQEIENYTGERTPL